MSMDAKLKQKWREKVLMMKARKIIRDAAAQMREINQVDLQGKHDDMHMWKKDGENRAQ